MAEQITTETSVVVSSSPTLAEPDLSQRPARLALYLGVALLALGAVVLYLGYNGVATNAVEVAQTPYLISGGMVGLGLLALGGVTLAVYVLLRVQGDLRTELQAMRSAIESLGDSFASQATYKGTNGSSSSTNGVVMVARGTTTFHRPDCRLVHRAESTRPMASDDARIAGMTPCRICKP